MTDLRALIRRCGTSVLAALIVIALGAAPHADTPDPNIPTAIEQAVIDYRCSHNPAAGASGTDGYQACLNAELLSLRSDFGRDLSRLSASTRRTIDSTCREPRELRGREAYVDCLSRQLAAQRRGRASSSGSAPDTALLPPSPAVPDASPETTVPTAGATSWRFYAVSLGAALLGLAGVSAGVVLTLKQKRKPKPAPPHKCGACGVEMSAAGDLCQRCRHEAAESVRRAAAAERALEQQKAQKAVPRPLPRT